MRRIRTALATVATAATLAGCTALGGVPHPEGETPAGGGHGVAAADRSSSSTSTPTGDPAKQGLAPASAAVLARTTLFPGHRLVGFAGLAGHGPGLGRLGVGDLDARIQELKDVGKDYADGATVVPTAEMIATVVLGSPGPNGTWCARATDDVVRQHLAAVRKVDGVLLLAIQPGRSDFVTETKYYEKWLLEPDVGVALDPEWRMGPDQVPMKTFGSVTGAELDQTASYLSGLVTAHHLPQKVMLYHQLSRRIVRDGAALKAHPGIAEMVSVDGIGSRSMKLATWRSVMARKPEQVLPGFKLFYQEDTAKGWRLMRPSQVLALDPKPDYVIYE